ncbi:elongator complex protein 3 [Clostridium thermarum]|uniref:elongator complex protein 3 n=1 Tax=Clostridium thermarum TaxID=1716543 RepID=UPI0011217D15|nr:radical SAM protein [Clostridium thermarum]
MSKRHYIIPLFVPHEGCPHNCVFCNQNSITGYQEKVTASTVHQTVQEYFKTIDGNDNIVEISFFGGTFTAIPVDKQIELLSAAKHYKDKGLINFIRLSTRPDYIDDEILTRLKHYSVDIIELGLQSMDNDVLRMSGRGHNRADTINASIKIKEYGFILGHQIMLGLPGDNIKKDLETAYASIALKPDLCRIYPALVLKNTPMELMYNRGSYKPYSLQEAIEIAKKLYCIYTYHGVNIIRVGLQATDNITEGRDIITGPYHPAFRELVEGSLICDMIRDEIQNFTEPIKLFINSRYISRLYANKKMLFYDMKRHITTDNLNVFIDDSLENGLIRFEYEGRCWIVSIFDYISKNVKAGKS